MSKISITPNASGTGVFTISSPATNTDRSLTLPDEAGTIITTAGVPSSAMPAGSVLQVVNGFTSTAVTSTALDAWVDTGITATITPTSASSKIMVIVNICGISKYSTNLWNRMGIQILRGSTVMGIMSLRNMYTASAMEISLPGVMYSKLDSPATTSATTYKVQFLQEAPGTVGGVTVQRDGNSGESQIFLMEISA